MAIAPGTIASIQLAFSVGRFGWTEGYAHGLAGGAGLSSLETLVQNLAKARAPLCGGGVLVENARLSDVAVRRDADDQRLDYFVISSGVPAPAGFTGLVVKGSYAPDTVNRGRALIPNVAMNIRIEGVNKVYHGQHMLSGIPSGLVGNDELIIDNDPWRQAFSLFSTFLQDNNFLFPVLDRTGEGNEDRKVNDVLVNGVNVNNASWAVGDRIRIINAVVPGKRRGGSIVGEIANLTTDPLGFTYKTTNPPVIPTGARGGPKTIAHRESSTYVGINFYGPEYITHRNRGRPLFSPRGRRSSR